MLGNRAEAEDMAQQTFVDAFTALRDFNPTYKFSSWLYRIAINNCKDYLKSKKRTETAFLYTSAPRISPVPGEPTPSWDSAASDTTCEPMRSRSRAMRICRRSA